MSSSSYVKIGPIIEIATSVSKFDLDEVNVKYDLEQESFFCSELGRKRLCLIENKNRPKTAPTEIEIEDEGDVSEITSHNIEEALEWFNAHFKDDIDAFKLEFGDENVKVYFGVCSYVM